MVKLSAMYGVAAALQQIYRPQCKKN